MTSNVTRIEDEFDALPDCDTCKDPTKRRSGTMFDGSGRGSVDPVWDCENEYCREKRKQIWMWYLRREDVPKKEKKDGKQERDGN